MAASEGMPLTSFAQSNQCLRCWIIWRNIKLYLYFTSFGEIEIEIKDLSILSDPIHASS